MLQGSANGVARRRRLIAVVAAVLAVGLVVGGIGVAARWAGVGSPTASTSTVDPSLAPGATPAGGISRADAIRIAADAASATQMEIETASAEVRHGDPSVADATDRWVWKVTFSSFAGPTSGRSATVTIDYFSGDVIDKREIFV